MRFPLPADDVLTLAQHEHEEFPRGVLLGGASAGVCIAAATALRVLDLGSNLQLEGVVLGYGFSTPAFPERRDPAAGSRSPSCYPRSANARC